MLGVQQAVGSLGGAAQETVAGRAALGIATTLLDLLRLSGMAGGTTILRRRKGGVGGMALRARLLFLVGVVQNLFRVDGVTFGATPRLHFRGVVHVMAGETGPRRLIGMGAIFIGRGLTGMAGLAQGKNASPGTKVAREFFDAH